MMENDAWKVFFSAVSFSFFSFPFSFSGFLIFTLRPQGVLFADISALVLNNRSYPSSLPSLPPPLTTSPINRSGYLKQILGRPEFHDRLVNGSDYPLPAAQILISTRYLQLQGLCRKIPLEFEFEFFFFFFFFDFLFWLFFRYVDW